MRAFAEHVGPVVTGMPVHSRGLPSEIRNRQEAEGAASVEVDREEIERLGVRLREADLLSEDTITVRHDPERLAKKACEAALVRP